MEEVARKWERRKKSRRDRITKSKGAREAMLDEAEDVIPEREVGGWVGLGWVGWMGWVGLGWVGRRCTFSSSFILLLFCLLLLSICSPQLISTHPPTHRRFLSGTP